MARLMLEDLLAYAGKRKNDVTNPHVTKQEFINLANNVAYFVLRQYVMNTSKGGNFPYISKYDLEVGVEYLCSARNFVVGTWNGEKFKYVREKYGVHFIDDEFHYDNGAPYGTVRPVMKLEDLPFWTVPYRAADGVLITKDEADIGLVALESIESELPEFDTLFLKLTEVANA